MCLVVRDDLRNVFLSFSLQISRNRVSLDARSVFSISSQFRQKTLFLHSFGHFASHLLRAHVCVCVDVCVLVAKKEPSCARIEMMENYLNWGAEKGLHLIASGDSFLELSSSCVLVRVKRNQL